MEFLNLLLEAFPGDSSQNLSSRKTPGVLFALAQATPVQKPEILLWSDSAGELLDLERPKSLDGEIAKQFSGCMASNQTYASRYGGHQFGHWAGQLGDGRALFLGSIINSQKQKWEVQLKGAGPTPYSRRADGRAVLRSSVREFLCSEAMHYLGVPTTRALCCITTGELVERDMMYDGNPINEPGAITTRLAPSFLRFGHFEILAAEKEIDLMLKLIDHTIKSEFPKIDQDYKLWFEEVCKRTAELMVDWQRVGFVHGVMNTDNMSLLGLTLDFGPYGWLDVYDPDWTPNTTDFQFRRYRFGQQPSVALWNLTRLAEALCVGFPKPEVFQSGLDLFEKTFQEKYLEMMGKKLGIEKLNKDQDLQLILDLDPILRLTEIDYTIFFRKLAEVLSLPSDLVLPTLDPSFYSEDYFQRPENQNAKNKFLNWIERYQTRIKEEKRPFSEIQSLMNQTNPYFILRNYLVQEALEDLQKGDRTKLDQLSEALQTPYEKNQTTELFFTRRPEWARNKPGCSALSCSS